MTNKLSRRSFLKLTGVAGGAFLLASCEFVDSLKGVPKTQLPMIENAWSISDGTLSLDLAKLPELEDLGGAVRIEGESLTDPILVVLGDDGEYYAFKNACTHAGRMIDPVAGSMTLECCSLSSSSYDYQGNVLSGPAEGALSSYPLTLEGDQLKISL